MAEELNIQGRRIRYAHESRGAAHSIRNGAEVAAIPCNGNFDSGFYDYDANWAFATLAATQNLAGVGDVRERAGIPRAGC